MSKQSNGGTALARLLESPALARVAPRLAPETLHALVERYGLDACGELVTSVTPVQLTSLLDIDLWRHARPGADEQFDVDRFGEWLEVLVDAGDTIAARTVAALDPHLVVTGLSRYIRVFDPGTFEPHESSDDEPLDRHTQMSSETSADVLECEVDGYLVRARRTDAWDAIVTLLVTLDVEHHDFFHDVMIACRRLSNSTPEIDGLDDLLMEPAQHLHDEAIERERRRSRAGYATTGDARAFLQLARRRELASSAAPYPNPIVSAYFREIDDRALEDAGIAPERTRLRLAAAKEDGRPEPLAVLRRLMEFVFRQDDEVYARRSQELAFLANVLVAGASVQSRPFTTAEASDAAAHVCNLGLEYLPDAADDFLITNDLVAIFELGWSVLHRDVSLFVADQLVAMLANLSAFDVDMRRDLRAWQHALITHGQSGTPWLARDAADPLALLDTTAWISVIGLLEECPVLPAALTAVLDGATTPVSATAFRFISTKADIGDVRVFMRLLPGLLSR